MPGESLNNQEAQVIIQLFWLFHLGKAWLPFELPIGSFLVVQDLFDHMLSRTLTITDVHVICCVLTLCPFLKSGGIVPCHLFILCAVPVLGQC